MPPDYLGLTSLTALQSFLEVAPDAIIVVDATGKIVVANGLAERMFGYAREEMLGQPIELLLPERNRALHVGDRNDYFREPRTRPMGEGRELSGRRKDGTEFVVEISLSPLESDQGPLVISIIRDTTQRRQAEAKFRGLLESAPDGIVVVDQKGRIVIVNHQTERIFGYSRGQLVGQPIEMLVPHRYKEIHVGHRAGFFENPKTRPMGAAGMPELVGLRRDGTEFPVEISLSPIETEEGILVSAAVRDVTERKLVEDKLRSSLKEKEVLLKEIHHRVKNNLQIVSSMLNLQMAQLKDPHARELFKQSQARVHSIALFHEKLYQSRDLVRVDMAGYLLGLATGLFGTYGINPDQIMLSVQVDDLPLGVDAAIACGLIVNELLSNALKYGFPDGRRGGVRVALKAEGKQIVLEVADDGIGFPPDLDLKTPKTLGLRLVRILAEQVRGSVELDRTAGTRVVVRFDKGEGA